MNHWLVRIKIRLGGSLAISHDKLLGKIHVKQNG